MSPQGSTLKDEMVDSPKEKLLALIMERSGLFCALARISHQNSASNADKLAVAVCAPCSRFDVVSTTTASTSSPRSPPQRHLDTLATKAGEKCGLARG
jgi:hypothetical protein